MTVEVTEEGGREVVEVFAAPRETVEITGTTTSIEVIQVESGDGAVEVVEVTATPREVVEIDSGGRGEQGEPGAPGPPGPPGDVVDPDMQDLTVLFENGLV
jgi:hypothetical protein